MGRQMKDSRVPWIGDVPVKWKNKKLVKIFQTIGSGSTPASSKSEYYGEGYYWLNTGDLNDLFIEGTKKTITEKGKNSSTALKIYPEGSLVMAMYGATIGKLGITKIPVTTNQACCVMAEPIEDDIKFIYYWLLGNRKEIVGLGYGGTQPNISQETIKKLIIPLPTIEEQRKIVDLLDQKMLQIEAIINDTKMSIGEFQKYKQALITEIVSEGVTKVGNLKNSGVEWIGEIPQDWIITKVKYNCYLKGRIGWQGLSSDEYQDSGPFLVTGKDFIDGKINWESCVHITEERSNEAKEIQLQENDVLITKDGTIGKVAIIEDLNEEASLNSGVLLIRKVRNTYIEKYFYYVLKSDIFWRWYESIKPPNSTILHLYQNDFKEFTYAQPSLNEQKQIAEYLDEQCYLIDNLIEKKQKLLMELEAYKKSLIYEYVTGKKEVL